VYTDKPVEDVGDETITFAGETLPVGLVLWAAGVAASPLGATLGAQTDKAGRVLVDNTMRARGMENVFVLGDAASFTGKDGRLLPGLAQVAKQQGIHLGRALARHIQDGSPLPPFEYRSRGNTAIVG